MVSGDPDACIDATVIAARDDGVFNLVDAPMAHTRIRQKKLRAHVL